MRREGVIVAGNSSHAGRTMISKITSILHAVNEGDGRKLVEIAATSQLPLSTAHRLVTELVDWRVLERDPSGAFRMGTAFRSPGRSVTGGTDPPEALRVHAAPTMEDVFRVTTTPVRVGFLAGVEVAFIEKSVAFRPVSRFRRAARLPVHATALGKVLAAYAPTAVVAAVVDAPMRRYTPGTVSAPDEFRAVLRSVRAKRVAVCDGELDPAWAGVAVPVFGAGGSPVAAIEMRVPDVAAHLARATTVLSLAASSLSRDLARHGVGAPVAVPWSVPGYVPGEDDRRGGAIPCVPL